MKIKINNGFTLIELLAVIVILAIVALIATPLILGIINNVKEESNKRSIEMYAKAIENAVALNQLTSSDKIIGTFNTQSEGKQLVQEGKTPVEIDYGGKVECDIVEIYEDGGIYLAECSVNDQLIEYTYGAKQITVGKFDSVCSIADDSTVQGYEAGSKYDCKVDPDKNEYTFYVLKTPEEGASTIDLILESNINISGEMVIPGEIQDEGLIAWNSEEEQGENSYGPVTAMTYLYEATINWTNILPVNYIYNDENNKDGGDGSYKYKLFESINGVAKINGIQFTGESLLRARIPIYSCLEQTEVTAKNEINNFLYENLRTNDTGPLGYWTLSSESNNLDRAWALFYFGSVLGNSFSDYSLIGVRPVITLEI